MNIELLQTTIYYSIIKDNYKSYNVAGAQY